MFETFEIEVGARAKRASALARQGARLAGRLDQAAGLVDLHELRQRVAEAVDRAAEAAAALAELQRGLQQPNLLFAGAPDGAEGVHQEYARAFERACADLRIPLEGTYPDYHVFPFEVKIRLEEDRALVGKRSSWVLRPAALAQAVYRERDRLLGASFAADRFGASLARAYDLRIGDEPGHPPVRLVDILEMLQLGNFGRNNYTRDEFAFDLYRFRQTEMKTGGRLIVFTDLRRGGSGLSVPNSHGGRDRLIAIRVVPLEAAALGN